VDVPTIVLVHGAGHTATAWDQTRAELRHPSIAVDLPGRRGRPADIAAVTIDAAADSICSDVEVLAPDGDVVVVAHSAGGVVVPAVAARLAPRVQHLVFVAGLCAPEGATVVDSLNPDRSAAVVAQAHELRRRYRGHMFLPDRVDDWLAIDDPKVANSIDGVNLITQPVSWRGVPATLPRTFVRARRDRIQPRAMQDRLIANCAASQVVDIDTGHTPALAAPRQLAGILDEIAGTAAGQDSSGGIS